MQKKKKKNKKNVLHKPLNYHYLKKKHAWQKSQPRYYIPYEYEQQNTDGDNSEVFQFLPKGDKKSHPNSNHC